MWSAPFATGATINTSRRVGIRPRSVHRRVRSGDPDGDRRPDYGDRAARAMPSTRRAPPAESNTPRTRRSRPSTAVTLRVWRPSLAGTRASRTLRRRTSGMEPPRPEGLEPNLAVRQSGGLTNCRMRSCMSGGVGKRRGAASRSVIFTARIGACRNDGQTGCLDKGSQPGHSQEWPGAVACGGEH